MLVQEATLPVTAGILTLYHFIVRPRVVCLFLRTTVTTDLEVFGNFFLIAAIITTSIWFIPNPLQQRGVRDIPATFWSGLKRFLVQAEVQSHNSSDGEGAEPGSLTDYQTVELLLYKGLGKSPPHPPCPLSRLAMLVGENQERQECKHNRYQVLVRLEREQGVSWLVTSGTGVCQLRCISWESELPPVSWAGNWLPAK